MIDVKKIMAKHNPCICAHCGCETSTKRKFICKPCRVKMKVKGISDIYRYFLIGYLLTLVKDGEISNERR